MAVLEVAFLKCFDVEEPRRVALLKRGQHVVACFCQELPAAICCFRALRAAWVLWQGAENVVLEGAEKDWYHHRGISSRKFM